MKIAIITTAHPTYTKGLASFVYEKCRRMKQQQGKDLQVDCFMIRKDVSPFMRLVYKIKGEPYEKWGAHTDECEVRNITYRCLWDVHTLWDNLVGIRIKKELLPNRELKQYGKLLKDYDVVCTHTLPAHCLGWYLWKQYQIPYVATWHGSDIHTNPYQSEIAKQWTKVVMKEAGMNYYVSKALQIASDGLVSCERKDVLYTGAAEHFYKYEKQKRNEVRQQLNPHDRFVIGFVGNLIPVKNVMTLPGIMKQVGDSLGNENVELWIVGNGADEASLREKLNEIGVNYHFWGKRQSTEMPDLYNSMDVLILPSLNEGFPLAVIEARSCGVNVVGSAVGGIPEAVGVDENIYSLDDDFQRNIATRIVEILRKGIVSKPLDVKYSWEHAIQKELRECRKLAREKAVE